MDVPGPTGHRGQQSYRLAPGVAPSRYGERRHRTGGIKWTALSRSTCAAWSTCSATTSTAVPRVYVRELLQNAVDAITARRAGARPRRHGSGSSRPRSTGDGTPARARHRHRADRGAGARAAGHHRPQLQARRPRLRAGTSSSASSASACSPASWWPTRSEVLTRHGDGADGALDRARRRPLRGRAGRRAASSAREPGTTVILRAAPRTPSSGSPPPPSPSWPAYYGSAAAGHRPRRRRRTTTVGAPPWQPRRAPPPNGASADPVRPGARSASPRSTSSTWTCPRPG